ncbi:chaperone modulatory protein CbpM [Seongchinamella sediminis]|uniref:Chaperone modulatory protein CbpM n=1 Tax=Seongchinamella sediminis TaxID=2283635 RepID=A0A3L7DYM3_9GAMM|nr:chaperone modulator CbpM [Seongchinamella sediminis]RLQ21759.1 chaperone modulatory protein CbpM [Seongchinamella sediminis]
MSTSILRITAREFCEREGVTEEQVVTIVEQGIARPTAGGQARDWEFDTTSARWMHKAIRLHRDLDLDWVATAMLVDLLRQRDRLHRENQQLRQQLQRFVAEDG